MPIAAFPVVSGAQIVAGGDATQKTEPGTIFCLRTNDQWSLVEYVQLDNNGCNKGEALVSNFATLKAFSVTKSATTDAGAPLRGIAAATIASQRFGMMIIGGYVEAVYVSQTAASGEYLMISGSTAAQLTSDKSSTFNTIQGTVAGSLFVVVGQSRAVNATGASGLSSAMLCGIWG